MTDPARDEPTAGAAPVNGAVATKPVIDLRESATTRVRVSRDDNPFASLSPPDRMKLIIRVLCEIVAYGEVDEDELPAASDEPARADQPDHSPSHN